MKNIILILYFLIISIFSFAQIHITPKIGKIYSFAKQIDKGTNPSPYFKVAPYGSLGFMGVNIGYIYNKFSFDISWEYTEVGLQTYDKTAATFCPDCKDVQPFQGNYGVPFSSFPIRIGYNIYSRKHIDVFAKLGYFQVGRFYDPNAFSNTTQGPFRREGYSYYFPDGTPFTKVSRNLQADFNMVYKIGKKKKYGISVDLVLNYGLKKLSEDKFITQIYKTNETYTNYVTRRGSYIAGNIGFIRIFQDSKKVRHTKEKHPKGRYF